MVQVVHSNTLIIFNESTGGDEYEIFADELDILGAYFCSNTARFVQRYFISLSLLSHLASVIDVDNPTLSTSKILKTKEIIKPFSKV